MFRKAPSTMHEVRQTLQHIVRDLESIGPGQPMRFNVLPTTGPNERTDVVPRDLAPCDPGFGKESGTCHVHFPRGTPEMKGEMVAIKTLHNRDVGVFAVPHPADQIEHRFGDYDIHVGKPFSRFSAGLIFVWDGDESWLILCNWEGFPVS